MSIKATIDCNLSCEYCYEHGLRKHQKGLTRWNIEKIKETMKKEYERRPETPSFHGGEPLVLPKKELENLMKFGYDLAGRMGIQTNGTLIDDDHIALFKKYNVNVGISFDGPWPLNKARADKETTDELVKTIYKLVAKGLRPGMIMVLHRYNGLPEHRQILKDWLLELHSLGIKGGRLNLAEINDPEVKERLELRPKEAADLYKDLAKFTLFENDDMRWQPFRDVVDNMLGLGTGTCVFGKCDFFQAVAERCITGTGELSTCYKNAINDHTYFYDPSKELGKERYQILKNVPQENGGCGNCKYWPICYGGCPAEGEYNGDIDWRHRTRHCAPWKVTYELIEKYIKRIFPNIQLIAERTLEETPKNDYQLRSGNRLEPSTLKFMLPRYSNRASSWRGEAKSNCKSNCKVNTYTDAPRVEEERHGDMAHGDHTDHGDS